MSHKYGMCGAAEGNCRTAVAVLACLVAGERKKDVNGYTNTSEYAEHQPQ